MERLWDGEWQRNLTDAAIERVKRRCNPQHYQAFYLSAVKNLPLAQITSMLGLNRAQVYLAKHRIASQVRKELKYLETKLL